MRRDKYVSGCRRCHPGLGQGAAPGRWQPARPTSFFFRSGYAQPKLKSAQPRNIKKVYEAGSDGGRQTRVRTRSLGTGARPHESAGGEQADGVAV